MKQHNIYIIAIAIAFGTLVCIFDFLPRSTYSALEKRDLKQFPKYSFESLKSGEFTKNINVWFSDSEPFRDFFMLVNMKQKNLLGITAPGKEQVKFHAASAGKGGKSPMDEEIDDREVGEYKNTIAANENAKIANRGIVVIGNGKNVRALMAFGGSAHGGVGYADAANKYKQTFGAKVNVYCMVIPTSIEFYCPDQAKKLPQIVNEQLLIIYLVIG